MAILCAAFKVEQVAKTHTHCIPYLSVSVGVWYHCCVFVHAYMAATLQHVIRGIIIYILD